MKIQIDAFDLQKFLKKSKGLYLNKLDLDLQKELLVQADKNIILIMNNLKTQLETKLFGTVLESGETLIPETALKILENFKQGSIIITNDSIQYDTKEIKYMPGSVDEFSIINDEINTNLFEVIESDLSILLEVNYATMNDETRPIFKGINIKQNKFIGLNGYYASIRYGDFNINENITISKSVWKALLKATNRKSNNPVKIFWNNKDLVKFKFKNFIVKGDLLDSNFLNIDNIIPNNYNTKATLDPNKLIKSLKLMDKLTKDKQLISNLSFKNDKLEIETRTPNNVMKDKVKLSKFEGNEIKIAFNIKYLLSVLNQYKNENVNIELNNSINPMLLKHKNKLDLILPVRLKNGYKW